jgi:hypothetical protein
VSRPRPKPRRRLQAGKKILVRDAVDFDCPFCKGKCSASEEKFVVLHSMPPCPKYLALEPDDYLAAVNDAMGSPRPN